MLQRLIFNSGSSQFKTDSVLRFNVLTTFKGFLKRSAACNNIFYAFQRSPSYEAGAGRGKAV